jgi:sulfoxide reductase heme-binding subunit YedZ
VTTNDLWFVARGAGLSALLVLTLSATLGALGSIKATSASGRVVVQYLHRTAAVLGLTLIASHVVTLVLDHLSHVSLAGALLPFTARYRPTAVGLGSLALYLFAIAAAVGLARRRWAGSVTAAKTWRLVHLLAYPAWVLAALHGLLAGTDRGRGWVVLLNLSCIAAVFLAVVVRLIALDGGSTEISHPRRAPTG